MGWEGPVTHRQFLAWRYWQQHLWEHPQSDIHLAYMMATVAETRRAWVANPHEVVLDDAKLKLKIVTPEVELTPEERKAKIKAVSDAARARLSVALGVSYDQK